MIQLHHGDCLDILRSLPAASVDAVVTDPPYAIPTIVAACRTTTRNVGDLSIVEAAFRTIFAEFERVLKPAGRMLIFCDGTSYPVVFRAAYGRFASALLVWDKERIGMGREFRKSHELIMHCWQAETPLVSDGTGHPDVLQCAPVPPNQRVHDAEKPVRLLKDLLWVCGQTVLDPFMGSGSTGEACIETGRDFIGIEIDKGYFDIAEQRIEASERARSELLIPA